MIKCNEIYFKDLICIIITDKNTAKSKWRQMLFFETVHAISFIVHTKDLTIKNIPGLNPEPWVPDHLKIMLKI